ncbi:MAG TPA: hypothetical protein PLD25_19250 [Chloroflexota bacterium]|nr:hypothetical protein [Chloroflexota bacterium]
MRAYLQSLIEAFKLENDQKPINPEVLAFVQWLLPVEEERQAEYRQAFKVILGDDPLWIPCMQCEHDGIFFDHVSEPRPKLTYSGEDRLFDFHITQPDYKTVPGGRILVGKCARCRITEHLHILTVVHALEKRKKVTGDLAIPDYILANADL